MKNTICCLLLSIFVSSSIASTKQEQTIVQNMSTTLKAAFDKKFYIGTALNLNQIRERDKASLKIVKEHYNSVVAENCMKSMYLQPTEGSFFFDDADKFVEFGEKNNMFIIGHTLIWHSQAPKWFFVDDKGNDVSKEVLIERMRKHITTIVSRYKGRIKGWDVVNEAIMEDGSYRKSKFYEIIGEEFIPLAFQFAHEADPKAELYYNDYNEWYKGKRATVVGLIKKFKERGIRIDAIGLQGHIGMDSPSLTEYQSTIDDYAKAGVKVAITELDMSALPSPRRNVGANISDMEAYRAEMNPYTAGLPDSVAKEWTDKMSAFFQLLLDNKDTVSRVTLWGVTDGDSWKNGFPMRGRTDYPLLFDREYKAKPIVQKIMDMAAKK